MKKRNLWRKVSSSLLAFFLALMIFGIYLIIGLRVGVFGNTTIERAIKDSKYYEESYHELESQLSWYLSETELAREVVLEKVSLQQFYIDASTQMKQILNQQDTKTIDNESFSNLQEDLTAKLKEAYAKKYVVVSEEQNTKINEISSLAVGLYQKQMDFSLVKSMMTYKNQFINYSTVILLVLIVIIGISTYLLLKMYRHKYKALRYVAYSIISACGMMVLFVLMLGKRIDYARIPKGPVYYQHFIENLTRESEIALLLPAGGGLILCCLLLVLTNELRKRAIGE